MNLKRTFRAIAVTGLTGLIGSVTTGCAPKFYDERVQRGWDASIQKVKAVSDATVRGAKAASAKTVHGTQDFSAATKIRTAAVRERETISFEGLAELFCSETRHETPKKCMEHAAKLLPAKGYEAKTPD